MTPTHLDLYRPRASLVHHLDPRVKVILTLGFVLATALIPLGAWPVYVIFLSLIFAVDILSELGVRYILTRALLVLPFALAALPLLFTTEGAPLWQVSWDNAEVTMTWAGLERLANVLIKSWLSVQAAIVLISSTPFPHLLAAMRAVHIPRLLVAIVGLMWRYLFVLTDEALRLMRARESRSGIPVAGGRGGGGSLVWRARVTGGMVGNLFLRAFDRADRIYAAMLARGYDGEVQTLPLPPLSLSQRAGLGVGLIVLSLLTMIGLLMWG